MRRSTKSNSSKQRKKNSSADPTKVTPEQFKSLQAKWYRKLEESGFQDIEKDDQIVRWDSFFFKAEYTPERFNEKKSYFEKAQNFLGCGVFIDDTERRIWELHSTGIPVRTISEWLALEGIEKNKNEVNQVINEFQRMMLK